jgi:hypothetical protein
MDRSVLILVVTAAAIAFVLGMVTAVLIVAVVQCST